MDTGMGWALASVWGFLYLAVMAAITVLVIILLVYLIRLVRLKIRLLEGQLSQTSRTGPPSSTSTTPEGTVSQGP